MGRCHPSLSLPLAFRQQRADTQLVEAWLEHTASLQLLDTVLP